MMQQRRAMVIQGCCIDPLRSGDDMMSSPLTTTDRMLVPFF